MLAVATPVLVAGCSGPLSTIDPAGPQARAVANLWWAMLAGATLLALFVFTLLALSFRRSKRGPERPRLWIGWLGLAMPSAVLLALLVSALVVGSGTLPTPADDVVTVEVTARRYAWDVRYASGRRTVDELHIPAGRPVDVRVAATDVIHSLWVPRLGGKMDAIPGHVNVVRLVADRPGTYRGECAEYCGVGHKDHRFTVIAHDDAGWSAFISGRTAR